MKRALLLACLVVTVFAGCSKKEGGEEEAESKPEAAEAAGPRRAAINAEAAQAAGIEAATAGPAAIREVLPLYGTVQPNGERTRNVTARFPGVIKSVRKAVGDIVSTGDLLATVESNDSLQTYSVTAPIAGTVTARSANAGETAGEQPLFVVTDLSTVWVQLSLFPRDLPKVKVGQSVRIKAVDGDLVAIGKVVWVSATGESSSQAVTARVLLDNRGRQWKPGLYVSAEAVLGKMPVPVGVAASAIQTLDGKSVVFVPGPRGYEPRDVRPGHSDTDIVEIVEGLRAGEQYVARGSFVVKAELEKAGEDKD